MTSAPIHRVLAGCAALCAVSFFLGRHTASPGADAPVLEVGVTPASLSSASVLDAGALAPERERAPADRLDALQAAATTPASEEAFLTELSSLAATDPERALQRARAAATPRRRELYLRAVLRGWGGADAFMASRWALENVPLGERRAAVEAIVQGSVGNPEDAMRAVSFLCAEDPALAGDHGNTFVAEFAHAGRFDLASRFAAQAPVEYRSWWLATAFGRWAAYQPEAALSSLGMIADPAVREAAAQGLVAGWAAGDPAALVARAQSFPAGEAREAALREGLRQWVSLDPGAASAWMERSEPSPGLDPGAAALATTPALVSHRPEVAASWAESITDPGLRADTLLDFVRLWAETDPSSARNYAATSPAMRPETRELALSSFQRSP